ncbi:MAG TPA: hypothetical protein VFS33_06645 [Gemmatimonadales bacterium]|jgi:hypothetical protein|nr:hypothetical protein [Gemmatimonadales bacterium]
MPPRPISDLFRRYVAGELSLDFAGEAISEQMRAGHRGISVDLQNVPAAQHERVMALMGYLKWRALTEAGVPILRPATDAEFSTFFTADMEDE